MQSASSDLVSLAEIRTAAGRIAPYVFNTPLVPMVPSGLSLKTESLQPVGAFKIRGAFNAILSLTPEERKRGVIAHSSGNHAQAVAYAAQRLGVTAIIVMPDNAPAVKLEATRRWGAEIHLVDFLGDARMQVCATLAQQHGYVVVPPFDSPTIIAGTGTIGLEILAQRPDVESIYIPVSGGGLISGIAAAVKQSNPAIRVIGVEPEFANDAQQSFRAGHIISVPPEQTIRTAADGLRVSQLGKLPWAHVRKWVDDIITVTEAQIKEAMRRIAAEARLVAEPSGAVAAAGALMTSLGLEISVAILSGGNVDPARYAAILAQ
ncbi:MAG TPA: threonine/serine dehydratase [Rhizomicrobium sp.]|nr:threonine/serine dehydratase [Rhizomicrobium sp.]